MAETKDPKHTEEAQGQIDKEKEDKLGEQIEGLDDWDRRTLIHERTHESVDIAVEAPYLSSLVAVVADYLSLEKDKTKLTAKEVKELVINHLDTSGLDESTLANFQEKLELFKLIRGQTGREIRRELRGFEKFKQYATQEMIAVAYLRERDNMLAFIETLIEKKTPALEIGQNPIDENFKNFLANSEKLYERILMEHNVVCMRAVQAGERTAKDHLPKFIREGGELAHEELGYDQLGIFSARKTQLKGADQLSKPVQKWIPLVGQTFTHAPRELGYAMLDSLGHVPEELYTKKKFGELSFAELARFHNDVLLRAQESQVGITGVGEEFHRQRILHSRTQLLKHLFLSGIAEKVKNPDQNQVIIDVNGIWINIAELHAHVPFAYVTDELCNYLVEHNWITKEDGLEIRLQRAKVNNDLVEEEKHESRKAFEFGMAAATRRLQSFSFESYMESTTEREKAKPECPGWEHAEISALIEGSPAYIPQIILYSGHRIPVSVIRYYLQHFGNEYYHGESEQDRYQTDKTINVLRIAEVVESVISEEVELGKGLTSLPQQPHAKASVRESHKLTETAKATYKTRQRILNDPRYYDIARIVGEVLENGIPGNSAEKQFLVFRGNFGKKGDQRHSFLEIVCEGQHGTYGNVVRILIAPDKHLNKKQRDAFERIPELDREIYERLEAFVMTYNHFQSKVKNLAFLARNPGMDLIHKEKTPEAITDLMQEINSIILTEFPDRYGEALRLYRGVMVESSKSYETGTEEAVTRKLTEFQPFLHSYVALCESLQREYAQKLYGPSNPAQAVENLSVDIKRTEVTFDKDFFKSVPEKEEKGWVCDEWLSTCGRTIRIVHAEADRSIPYAMEAKAIRALGLLKDRPLINIAGGCRDTDYARDEESPSIKMGRQIMQIADKYNANVAPPGTQSGFGADISKVWLEYQDRTDHLAETEKAKCFAVSPGGETYYPGNPRLSNDPEREIYAVANMDSILTPFDAGWNWKGARKEDAPYFNHVEYMEAIYERLSEGQKRVMVIGNGGLFTIVEGIAALKNHVPIVITEDTGRFADFVINIFRHFNNDDLLNNFQNRRDEIDAAMLVIINDYVPEEYRKRLLKDFGKEVPAENPEIEIYRKQLYEFLLLTRGQKIETSSIDNLSETIDKILRKQEH